MSSQANPQQTPEVVPFPDAGSRPSSSSWIGCGTSSGRGITAAGPSTQNQALSALLFLYKQVLTIEIGAVPPVVRARTPERLPVVLSRNEMAAILKQLTGTARLVVMLL